MYKKYSRHVGDMSARHDILPTLAFLEDKNRRHVFADMSPTLQTCLRDMTCLLFWGASRHDTTQTFPTKMMDVGQNVTKMAHAFV